MNTTFFQKIEGILHSERIDAYRQDGADAKLTMARYSLNMALSESLYPTLQFSEIAFASAFTFSNTFLKWTGRRPSEFRR